MRFLILMAATSLALGSAAYADVSEKKVAECSILKSSVERLACFDRLSEASGLAPSIAPVPIAGAGKWTIAATKNPLTDKTNYIAALESTTKAKRSDDYVTLAARCADKKTSLFISWSTFLGADEIDVDYRVGRGKAAKSTWGISTDHKSSFYRGSAAKLLKEISTSDKFIARLTPYGESPITVEFDVDGAAEAFADIRKNCGW